MYSNKQWQDGCFEQLIQELLWLGEYIDDVCTSSKERALEKYSRQLVQSSFAIDQLAKSFNLDLTERTLLLLVVGWELEPGFKATCANALGEEVLPDFPTSGQALKLLPEVTKRHFSPNNKLFRLHLLKPVSEEYAFLETPLKLNRWVLYYLMGEYVQNPVFPVNLHPKTVSPSRHPLPESYTNLYEQIVLQWENAVDAPPLTQLCGTDTKAHHIIAAQTCEVFGYKLVHLKASAFAQDRVVVNQWLEQWKRESLLYNQVLLLEVTETDTLNPEISQTLIQLIEIQQHPLLFSVSERLQDYPDALSLDINELTLEEQKQQWFYHLQDYAPQLKNDVGKIVAQFNTTLHNIHTITQRAITQIENPREGIAPKSLPELVWQICRTESRSRLEGLVERIEPKTTWDELILQPDSQKRLIQIIAACQHRSTVYDTWGMGGKTHRGMGITSLFYGPSGTGKTTAAEIIAHDLALDLYRVDLSQVSSKYIGETEKNLKKIFEAAQESGAVLLFDEADSLIGKRSEVKDARDQYANQTVGYLLQAMERYSGLAILTTNLPNSLDTAFNRRIRYRIRFEYPTPEQRVRIWEKNFPSSVPTLHLSFSRLAQVNLSGAIIRKAATEAGFIAMAENEPVQMKHAYQAILGECLAEGRPLTDTEIRGWEI
jgi:ATPase family associated with various cellular activities (AAA)